MGEIPPDKDPKIISAKFNPLADYKLQIKANKKPTYKAIKQTSLSNDPRMELMSIGEEYKISYLEDMGNFEHSKILTSAKNRNLILSLGPNSQKLFIWILFALEYRKDTVQLIHDNMTQLGFQMSPNTFRKSIDDLETKGVIKRVSPTAKSEEYWHFFINPQILFKGDAKRFYNDVSTVHPEYKNPV